MNAGDTIKIISTLARLAPGWNINVQPQPVPPGAAPCCRDPSPGVHGFSLASWRRPCRGRRSRGALRDAGTVLLSPLALAEVDHLALARFGAGARSALIDVILFQAQRERFVIPHITVGLLETARKVQGRYAGLDLDLADAVNVALAAEYRTHSVLTLDAASRRHATIIIA